MPAVRCIERGELHDGGDVQINVHFDRPPQRDNRNRRAEGLNRRMRRFCTSGACGLELRFHFHGGRRRKHAPSAAARYAGRVRSLCTLLVALLPLVAWGAEPEPGPTVGPRVHRARSTGRAAGGGGAAGVRPPRRAPPPAASPRSAAGALEVGRDGDADHAGRRVRRVLKLERTDVGTVALMLDGAWRRPTWVHVLALDVVLPADAVTLFGRDLVPVAAPPLAVLERFDPKWLEVRRGDGGYTLDRRRRRRRGGGQDGRRARQPAHRARDHRGAAVRARRAACKSDGARPTRTCGVAARLRTIDEHVHARCNGSPTRRRWWRRPSFPTGGARRW